MDERPMPVMIKLLAVLMFVFLLAPLLIVAPIAFSGDAYMAFPPSSWSLKWFRAIFSDGGIMAAFWTSLTLAGVVTLLCLAIGLPAAYVLVRMRPHGADALSGLFTAPLLLPTIVLGLAILIVFAKLGLLASFPGLVLGHLVVTLPYALRVLSTSLEHLPAHVEDAASTLGAAPFTVFRRITLPMMRPGLIGTMALCFLVSFDETMLSLLMTGPRIVTLPVAMYHHIEQQADPLIAAISLLIVLLTLLVVMVLGKTNGLGRLFVK